MNTVSLMFFVSYVPASALVEIRAWHFPLLKRGIEGDFQW